MSKIECPHCDWLIVVGDPPPVKEPCKCGLTDEVRIGRVAIPCILILALGIMLTMASCEYIELEKIRAVKDSSKFDVKMNLENKLKVVPHEEKK